VRAQVHAARGEVDAARRDCLGALQSRLVLVHDTDIRLLDSLQIAADLLERGVLAEDDVLDSSALRGALAGLPPHTALREAVAVLRGGTDGTARDASVLPSRLVLVGLRERLLGTGHPSLGASLAVTAGLLSQEAYQGEVLNETCLLEAVALFRRAIPLQIAANGADSPLVGKSYEKLATCMVALGRLREGTQWFARDCELWMRQPPELRDEFQILIRARWTAWHATRAGEYELGLAWAERTLDVLAHTLGPDDGGAALVHACRALCFAQLERQSEAEASDARAVDILARQTVPDDQRIECDRLLALTRLRLGRIQDARELLEPAWVAVQPMFERGSKVLRCEWSQAMLQYCRALGDNGRAQEFANRLRDEGTGDLRPGITERVFGSELEPSAAP
jgi:tetratricopeptide (TPR) repeat protein